MREWPPPAASTAVPTACSSARTRNKEAVKTGQATRRPKVSNGADQPVVVVYSDPTAAATTTWTQWAIPLQSFADKGINLKNRDRIAIGLGMRGNMTAPGGSGKMYIDDISLSRP